MSKKEKNIVEASSCPTVGRYELQRAHLSETLLLFYPVVILTEKY